MRRSLTLLLLFLLSSWQTAHAETKHDQQFGHLRGRFVYDGPPPERKRIEITADRDALGDVELFDESLVVHPRNGGIANICVWMYRKRGEDPPPMHPSHELNPDMDKDVVTRTMTARRGRFEPHVLLVRTGERVAFKNGGRIAYNAKIDVAQNLPIGPLIPPSAELTYTYDKPERLPCRVSCNIHAWMQAYVIIQDHPYMAVTDANGNFEIKNIPTGAWTFQFWHEKAGYIRELTIDDTPIEWPRGRATFKIGPMPTDLGMMKLSAEHFVE